jgi:hypothetical protein
MTGGDAGRGGPTDGAESGGAGQVTGAGAPPGRADRAMRGALAAALVLEALTVLFVPRAIAQSGSGLSAPRLAALLTLAAALGGTAFLQRRRVGPGLGSALQLAVIATGVLTPVMYALGVIFALVWVYLLRLRRELTGREPSTGPPGD